MTWSSRSASAPAGFNGLLLFPQYSRALDNSPMPVPPKAPVPIHRELRAFLKHLLTLNKKQLLHLIFGKPLRILNLWAHYPENAPCPSRSFSISALSTFPSVDSTRLATGLTRRAGRAPSRAAPAA